MEKTLHTIQKFAKVGKVLSTIIFVICIVAAALCVVGAICWQAFGNFEYTALGGVTISGIVNAEEGGVVTACAAGFVLLLGEIILAKSAQKYFKRELKAGTPFTLSGAKELMRLGVKTIVIPVASYIAAAIMWYIMRQVFQMGGGEFDQDITINLGLGIMFMIGSLLCKLGAQQSGEKGGEQE